jgi:hypothetical protein
VTIKKSEYRQPLNLCGERFTAQVDDNDDKKNALIQNRLEKLFMARSNHVENLARFDRHGGERQSL